MYMYAHMCVYIIKMSIMMFLAYTYSTALSVAKPTLLVSYLLFFFVCLCVLSGYDLYDIFLVHVSLGSLCVELHSRNKVAHLYNHITGVCLLVVFLKRVFVHT